MPFPELLKKLCKSTPDCPYQSWSMKEGRLVLDTSNCELVKTLIASGNPQGAARRLEQSTPDQRRAACKKAAQGF